MTSPDKAPPDVGGRDDRLLSWDQVERIASISRSTAWRMERDGTFPGRVRVSPGRVGWWESELTLWKQTRSGQLPAPPPRKAARAPRLPGMPRAMPQPAVAPASDPSRPETRRRRKPAVPSNQIDFGF